MASLSPSKLVDILGVRFGKELRAIDNSEVIKKWNDAKMESVAS